MRLWVLEFGRVTKRERDGEVEAGSDQEVVGGGRRQHDCGYGFVDFGWWVCAWRTRWRLVARGSKVLSSCTTVVVRPCTKALRKSEKARERMRKQERERGR